MSKYFSLMLAFALVFSLIPSSIFAEDSNLEDDNTIGTEEDNLTEESTDSEDSVPDDGGSNEDTTPSEVESNIEGEVNNEDEETSNNEGESGKKEGKPSRVTDVIYEDGFHVDVSVASALAKHSYVPNFTLELWTTDDDKISSAQAKPNNYNEEDSEYNLVLEHPGYSPDDEFAILLRDADGVVSHIDFTNTEILDEEEGEVEISQYELTNGTHFIYTVEQLNYLESEALEYEEEEGVDFDRPETIRGSEGHPVQSSLEFNEGLLALHVSDGSGNSASNSDLEITLENRQGSFEATTNGSGYVFLDRSDLTSVFMVEPVGNGLAGEEFIDQDIMTDTEHPTIPVHMLDFEFAVTEETSHIAGEIDFSVETNSNLDLTTSWTSFTVVLEDSEGEQMTRVVNHEDTVIGGVVDDTYGVSVQENDYANVSLSSNSVTVTDGEASLSAVVDPEYILEVHDAGDDYNFSVINVSDISDDEYTGTSKNSFGVKPGDSYMVEDNNTGQIHSVNINPESKVTTLILSEGVSYGGTATTPHTGDTFMYLISFFAFSLVLLGVSAISIYRKKRILLNKNAVVSSLLVFVLVAPLLIPYDGQVQASGVTIGGTPGQSGTGSVSSPLNVFQLSEYIQLASFSFQPPENEYFLNEESTNKQLEKTRGLQPNFSIYIAPSKNSYDVAMRSGSNFSEYNSSIGRPLDVWGTSPLYATTHTPMYGSNAEFQSRVIGDATSIYIQQKAKSEEERNWFLYFTSKALHNTDPSNPKTRTIADSPNAFGDLLAAEIEGGYSSGNLTLSATEAIALLINGYVDMLEEQNEFVDMGSRYSSTQEYWDQYRERLLLSLAGYDYGSDEFMTEGVTFFTEVVAAIGLQDGGSYLTRDHSFISMVEATDWYLDIQKEARPWNSTIQDLKAEHQHKAVALGGAPSSSDARTGSYAQHGGLPFTFRTIARDGYMTPLKPTTLSTPVSSNYNTNPFGGWSFQSWRDIDTSFFASSVPQVTAKQVVKVLDDNGKQIDEFERDLPGYTTSADRIIEDLQNGDSIQGSYNFPSNGKVYKLLVDDAKFELRDSKDQESLLKSNLTVNNGNSDSSRKVENKSRAWAISWGIDTPPIDDINNYLGGHNSSNNAYKYGNDEDDYSNAELTFTFYTKESDVTTFNPNPVDSEHKVEQWKLSSYTDDMSEGDTSLSAFMVYFLAHTYDDPTLTPSGNIPFALIDPNTSGVDWAYSSNAKTVKGDDSVKNIDAYDIAANFKLSGDLLAVKTNDSISQNKLASWVNGDTLFDGLIGNTTTGQGGDTSTVTKTHTFKYGVDSQNDPFKYSETDTDSYSGDNEIEDFKEIYANFKDNNRDNFSFTDIQWKSDTVVSLYQDSIYNNTTTFNNYIPINTSVVSFSDKEESDDHSYWKTHQDGASLQVNPEVLMAYDDQNGNTNVTFVAGQEMREIDPVHYNKAEFKDVVVTPEITGMSAATDSNARQLASSLGAGGSEVIYKGSATTNSFEVGGELEFKTYALDIGNTALKNTWGNSGYFSSSVNDNFLNEHGSKNSSGKWEVDLTAEGKFSIEGDTYGGEEEVLTATEKDSSNVEHTLEIRGGKLIGVNGSRNLSNLSSDLEEALERMNIVNGEVFNSFERNNGAILTDSFMASVGSSMRGDSSLAVGKGWYNEDSVVLTVREFTTTFDLPSHMYSDKLPMEFDTIPNLNTPMDMSGFFSKGVTGHSYLKLHSGKLEMIFDSGDHDTFGGEYSIDYILPNVSVMDSFGQ
ncbi:hypothetical protein [Salipaludibacillus sp. CF4.18]|uniref:hypothetical protein n=1 Tax=Salipaludibacillus sp. CF4.18 TaxID=3373081 RepID=UPI003EE72E76